MRGFGEVFGGVRSGVEDLEGSGVFWGECGGARRNGRVWGSFGEVRRSAEEWEGSRGFGGSAEKCGGTEEIEEVF